MVDIVKSPGTKRVRISKVWTDFYRSKGQGSKESRGVNDRAAQKVLKHIGLWINNFLVWADITDQSGESTDVSKPIVTQVVQIDNTTCSWLAAGAACILGLTELGSSHETLTGAFAGLQ